MPGVAVTVTLPKGQTRIWQNCANTVQNIAKNVAQLQRNRNCSPPPHKTPGAPNISFLDTVEVILVLHSWQLWKAIAISVPCTLIPFSFTERLTACPKARVGCKVAKCWRGYGSFTGASRETGRFPKEFCKSQIGNAFCYPNKLNKWNNMKEL